MARCCVKSRQRCRDGKPSICFVSPNNYAILSGRSDLGHIGGAEIQQPMIARELLRRGYPVSFITLDHGQPDGIEHDGIRVYKMCSRNDGLPGLRFFHPRWTSLWRAMTRADADVYYQMNAGSETGQTSMWCRRHDRSFLFAVSSDTDCRTDLSYLRSYRERALYRYGLRHATRVIAQTSTQVRMLRVAFGLEAVLIRSCSADPAVEPTTDRPSWLCGRPRLLWVGRFAKEKRPEVLLDLAVLCPEYHFDIVGTSFRSTEYADYVLHRASDLKNMTLHGPVPHSEIGQYYDRASLLLCTSAWEGYPNTFMEAWARSVPVVSTVDPDNVIASNALGRLGKTVPELRTAIRALLSSENQRQECSQRARRFFLENHTIKATVDAYEQVLAAASQQCAVPA